MGNCCCSPCCGRKRSLASEEEPRGGGSIKFQLMDDEWADEIWYDALERHPHPFNDNHHPFSEGDEREQQEGEGNEDSLLREAGGEVAFDVTTEELNILRQTLGNLFPKDSHYMSDAYLKSVASKPYSKDMTRRRPLEYSLEKLTHVMEWRQQMDASDLPDRIRLCLTCTTLSEAITATTLASLDAAAAAARWKRAQAMVESLNTGSMYWHGLTKEGRPILWIRTNRKFWYPNVPAEVDALIAMADAGIGLMPNGVTDFVCISHSHKPPPPNPTFAYQMMRGLVKGYPDRMHLLVSAPVSSIVEFCMNLLLPIMPGRLAHKFCFYSLDHVPGKLESILWRGQEDIPTFFGGPVNHDQFYPAVDQCPSRGGGLLKFDWYGMMDRLRQEKEAFEKQQQLEKL